MTQAAGAIGAADGPRRAAGGASLLRGDPAPMAVLDRLGMRGLPACSPEDALAYAHRLTNRTGENFSVLSRLVPAAWREDFAAVYAFCRWADDLADATGNDEAARERSLELLAWWREELHACTEGEPRHPVFVSLAGAIERRRLTAAPFHRLIDAFEQDQRVLRYRTWDEVIGYCRGSADPVGHLVLQIGGVRPPEEEPGNAALYAQSDSICTALQLTNHWQDVRRDLDERGRVYLPSDETGIDADELAELAERGGGRRPDPAARVRYIRALRPLVERTAVLYEKGAPLPGALATGAGGDTARPLGRVVGLLAAGGRTVLGRIEAAGCTTLWHRPRITKVGKAVLILRHLVLPPRGSR